MTRDICIKWVLVVILSFASTMALASGDCTDYTDLSGMDLPIAVSGTTADASEDYTPFEPSSVEPDCWQGSWTWACGFSPDVTYKWTAPSNGNFIFSIESSNFDTVLLIYTFTCPVEPVYPDDFICGAHDGLSHHPRVTHLELTEGEEILIVVDGYYNQSGVFDLTIDQAAGAEVAVIWDTGVGTDSVIAFEHFLDWKGVTHTRIGYHEVNYVELSNAYEAIFFPGGTYNYYLNRINSAGDQHIRDLVDGGGAYIGICAGAYFAADQVVWEGGDVQDFPLDLFPGTAIGSIHEIAPWPYCSMTSITLDPTNPINQYESLSHTTFYHGGPAFYPHEGEEIETIATYDEYNDERAMINFSYGAGRVLLMGPHPEFEEDSDRDGTTVGEEFDDEGSEWNLLWTAVDWVLGRPISIPSAVPGELGPRPISSATLYPNHPNPFNPQTTIAFDIPKRESVTLRVFDMAGRLVRKLITAEPYTPGRHEVVWNGRDDSGRLEASGTYFYRLEAGALSETKRMVLIK